MVLLFIRDQCRRHLGLMAPNKLPSDQRSHLSSTSSALTTEESTYAVVNDEVGGAFGIDGLWVPAGLSHRVAHGRQVDEGGNAGEVLQHHAAWNAGKVFKF